MRSVLHCVPFLSSSGQSTTLAVDFPDFIAQVALQLLSKSSHAVKIVSQFHRYMSVYDPNDVVDFENMCAVGRPATINIDLQQSLAELPRYKRLMDDPGPRGVDLSYHSPCGLRGVHVQL